MSRIILDVPNEIHHQIKAMASLRGKTIKAFVLSKIFTDKKNLPNEKTIEAMQNVIEGKNLTANKNLEELYKNLGI